MHSQKHDLPRPDPPYYDTYRDREEYEHQRDQQRELDDRLALKGWNRLPDCCASCLKLPDITPENVPEYCDLTSGAIWCYRKDVAKSRSVIWFPGMTKTNKQT